MKLDLKKKKRLASSASKQRYELFVYNFKVKSAKTQLP